MLSNTLDTFFVRNSYFLLAKLEKNEMKNAFIFEAKLGLLIPLLHLNSKNRHPISTLPLKIRD